MRRPGWIWEVVRAGDEADNRQHQEHQHAGEPVADQPEVE
jgi:hypothetical protein